MLKYTAYAINLPSEYREIKADQILEQVCTLTAWLQLGLR